MSADNYYLIREHPAGGYAVVMGFASDDYEPFLDPRRIYESYPTLEAAIAFGQSQYSEYGVRVHDECLGKT